jgi:hypothetical protein
MRYPSPPEAQFSWAPAGGRCLLADSQLRAGLLRQRGSFLRDAAEFQVSIAAPLQVGLAVRHLIRVGRTGELTSWSVFQTHRRTDNAHAASEMTVTPLELASSPPHIRSPI